MKIISEPIIVIGMHRSGTSLISRCLSEMGLYMGSDLSTNAESKMFQQINREILKSVATRWDDLVGLSQKCISTDFEHNGFKLATRALFDEKQLVEFFPKRNGALTFFRRYPKLWGWKDPRNTWTLPIYMRIFPNAKVIHVFRNGVDCAISLFRRESSPETSISEKCKSFNYCFHLWESYLSRCLDLCSGMSKHNIFELSYEQFLKNPKIQLDNLVRFTNARPTTKNYQRIIESINPERLNNSILREKYKQEIAQLPNSRLMNKMGYSVIK